MSGINAYPDYFAAFNNWDFILYNSCNVNNTCPELFPKIQRAAFAGLQAVINLREFTSGLCALPDCTWSFSYYCRIFQEFNT